MHLLQKQVRYYQGIYDYIKENYVAKVFQPVGRVAGHQMLVNIVENGIILIKSTVNTWYTVSILATLDRHGIFSNIPVALWTQEK